MKRPQNIIAEGSKTLLITALFGLVVWLLIWLHPFTLEGQTERDLGLEVGLWPQLACFVVSVYLLVELSNQNALLRVRSRMVSSTFIMLSCATCFLLPHLAGGFVQLCFIASFLLMFQTYQDTQSPGRIFYAFLFIGLASLSYIHVLWYIPLLWVLMATQLQSLSLRTWFASLIGLATPYWFALLWLLLPLGQPDAWTIDLSPLGHHFEQLVPESWGTHSWASLSLGQALGLALPLLLVVIGIAHFWQYSFEDKIRIRLLFGFFISMTAFTLAFILVQPQHINVLMRIFIICASPLIAHVFTFTSSRLSNILFFVALFLAVAITGYNIVQSS